MTNAFAEMSEEEIRARSEAAALGRMQVAEAAIQALIAVAPQPDYIKFAIIQALASIADKVPSEPQMAWVPEAVMQGADPVASAFIKACEANRNYPKA